MINYSIIIPHYNRPDLLERALASIPMRDDVEVIVVDDHSDKEKVDFEHFPGLGRKNTSVIFSNGNDGKGPGYARNVGLDAAVGKWIIFLDADDYFLPSLAELMDKYVDDTADVIYFSCSKQSEGNSEVVEYDYISEPLHEAINGNPDALLYETPSPVSKFIKKDYLLRASIRFQCVIGGDDILFSILLSKNTQSRRFVDESFYCVMMEPDSLSRTTDWHRFYSFTIASCSTYTLLKPIGKEQIAKIWILSWWRKLAKANKWKAITLIPLQIKTIGVRCTLSNIKKVIISRKYTRTF